MSNDIARDPNWEHVQGGIVHTMVSGFGRPGSTYNGWETWIEKSLLIETETETGFYGEQISLFEGEVISPDLIADMVAGIDNQIKND